MVYDNKYISGLVDKLGVMGAIEKLDDIEMIEDSTLKIMARTLLYSKDQIEIHLKTKKLEDKEPKRG